MWNISAIRANGCTLSTQIDGTVDAESRALAILEEWIFRSTRRRHESPIVLGLLAHTSGNVVRRYKVDGMRAELV